MNNFLLRILFSIFLALLLKQEGNATEIIGGSLRYEALGNQKYKIIGTVNRSCNDSALGIPIFKIFAGSTSYNLTATRTAIKDITLYCKSDTPRCKPNNTIAGDGQEQHTFEATVDFSQSPYNSFYTAGKCQVMFSIEACCRSLQTTNITANNFYLEAMLNLCALGNSLENSNSKSTPLTYIEMCGNLPAFANFGSSDKEDSVYFFISIPKKSKDSFERFIGPFNTKYPMTPFCIPSGIDCAPLPNAKPPRGFTFDNATGDIVLTPSNINERAILNIQSNEFRRINGVVTLVGYSTTEMFIKVRACADNNPPAIPTANQYSVCEGNKLCFTIKSTDTKTASQTKDDTTTLTWNYGIPGATLRIIDPTAREKQAEFCWQTKIGDARANSYNFTVTAKDDNCSPHPLAFNKGFSINVKPKAEAIRQYRKKSGNQLIFDANPTDTGNYTPTYEWQINDTLGHPALYKTFKQKDSFKFKDTGCYFITMTINNLPYNCPSVYIDTVYMDGKVTTSINKISLNSIHIYPNPTSGFITIDLDKNKTWTDMKLLNNIGQVVYTGPAIAVFDMSKYAAGFYTIELVSKEGKHIAQVVKE